MNPDIKGIISDMDGVILDTEKLYVRFWCEAANFYGYPMERIELMDKFISENGIESKPGAAEFLGFLKQNGYRVALATATAPERTKKYLSALGLYDYFDEIVCASMVAKGKPEPDIYLYAAEKLGLAPENCIALEDSLNGIKSASSAGCKTVMVPDLDRPSAEAIPLLYGVADNLIDVKRFL